MRDLLIIFAVLLVVLVIISALGGSVRTSLTAPSEAVRVPGMPVMPSLRQPFINDSMPAEVADLQTTMPDLAPPAASRVRAEESPLVVGFDGSEALASF